jgi:choline kinase
MRALILSAGRGSRMGEKTAETPKCLLQVGGKTLIEHQLETLADCGIGPVGMVVGYCADEIREAVGYRAEFIENSVWWRTNSLYSFWIAREWADGELLVLNSDLLLDPKIVEEVLKIDGDGLAYDSGSGDGAEQMKVEIENRRVVAMSKTLSKERIAGENVGILKFQESTARRLFDIAGTVIERGGENDWLSSAISSFVEETPIVPVDITGLPWAEIDFPFDLDRARKRIWPAIRANRRARRWPRRLTRWIATAAAAMLTIFLITNLLKDLTPAREWEQLEFFELTAVLIASDHREERWWRLAADELTSIEIIGPTRLRIDSRILIPKQSPPTTSPTRYAVEASLDGVPLKWKDQLVRPSTGWHANGQSIGKRNDFQVDVPEGLHEIGIRFIGVGGPGTLVRVAREVSRLGDDD